MDSNHADSLKDTMKIPLANLCHSRYSVYMPLNNDSNLLHFDRIMVKIFFLKDTVLGQ